MKDKTSRFLKLLPTFVLPLIFLIVGITMFFFTVNWHPSPEETRLLFSRDCMFTISQLLITIAVGSLCLEFIGNVAYAKSIIQKTLTSDEFIAMLSKNKKLEYKSKLIQSIYADGNREILNDKNNITTLLDNDIDEIVKDYYFENYDISLFIEKTDKYIEKKFYLEFEAKTISEEKVLLPFINSQLTPVDGEDKPIVVTKLTIGDKVFTDEELEKLISRSPIEGNYYSQRYSMQDYIEDHKTDFTVNNILRGTLEYTSKVPLEDKVFASRMPKACKHFAIRVDSSDYVISITGFGLGAIGGNSKMQVKEMDKAVQLKFNDWILPGEGIVVHLIEK